MKIPTGSIPADDPQFAGYVIEFRSQVDFFKNLAKNNWFDSPSSEKENQEKKMMEFLEVSKILEDALDLFTYEDFKNPGPSFSDGLVKLGVFIYIYDKVNELYESTVKINKDGLYALFDNVREWSFNLMTREYFARSSEDIIKDYILSEAQLVACAELSMVELIPIQDAAAEYQPQIFERLKKIVSKAKQATEPKTSQETKSEITPLKREAPVKKTKKPAGSDSKKPKKKSSDKK